VILTAEALVLGTKLGEQKEKGEVGWKSPATFSEGKSSVADPQAAMKKLQLKTAKN